MPRLRVSISKVELAYVTAILVLTVTAGWLLSSSLDHGFGSYTLKALSGMRLQTLATFQEQTNASDLAPDKPGFISDSDDEGLVTFGEMPVPLSAMPESIGGQMVVAQQLVQVPPQAIATPRSTIAVSNYMVGLSLLLIAYIICLVRFDRIPS